MTLTFTKTLDVKVGSEVITFDKDSSYEGVYVPSSKSMNGVPDSSYFLVDASEDQDGTKMVPLESGVIAFFTTVTEGV